MLELLHFLSHWRRLGVLNLIFSSMLRNTGPWLCLWLTFVCGFCVAFLGLDAGGFHRSSASFFRSKHDLASGGQAVESANHFRSDDYQALWAAFWPWSESDLKATAPADQRALYPSFMVPFWSTFGIFLPNDFDVVSSLFLFAFMCVLRCRLPASPVSCAMRSCLISYGAVPVLWYLSFYLWYPDLVLSSHQVPGPGFSPSLVTVLLSCASSACRCISNIVLLNLLIACYADEYSRIEQSADIEFALLRYRVSAHPYSPSHPPLPPSASSDHPSPSPPGYLLSNDLPFRTFLVTRG